MTVFLAMGFDFDNPVNTERRKSAALWITTAEYNSR